MTEELRLVIKTEAQKAVRELDQLKQAAGGAESAALKVGDALSAATFAAGVKVIKDGIQAFLDQERALARLNAVYKATDGAVGLTVDELVALSTELQNNANLADDLGLQLQSVLMNFKSLQGEGFKETARLAVDLAAAMGGDAVSAAQNLGRALENPAEAGRALRSVNVILSDSEEELINSLIQTNQLGEAQAIILDRVRGQVGGTAEALRNTLGGSVEAAANAFGDLLEVVGEGFAPAIRAAAEGIKSVSEFLQNMPPGVLATATAVGTLTAGLKVADTAAKALGLTMNLASGPTGWLILAAGAVVGLTSAFIELTNSMGDANLRLQEGQSPLQRNQILLEGAKRNLENLRLESEKFREELLAQGQSARDAGAAVSRVYGSQLAQAEGRVTSLSMEAARLARESQAAAVETEALGDATSTAAEEINKAAEAASQKFSPALRDQREDVLKLRKEMEKLSEQMKATAARDMEDVLNAMSGDGTAADPFDQMAQGAAAAVNAFNAMQPAINGVSNVLSELDNVWKAQQERYLAGLEEAMNMEQLRYSNLIANAKAAGESTAAIEQEAANAALKAQTKLDAEKARIEKQAFERDKALKLGQIAMATALGVANAISTGNIALAAIVGALGAAQAGIVATQEYPGLADGGTLTRAGTVMVGERGPELLTLPKAATVTPLDRAGGLTVVIQNNTFAGVGGVDELVQIIHTRMGQLARTGALR